MLPLPSKGVSLLGCDEEVVELFFLLDISRVLGKVRGDPGRYQKLPQLALWRASLNVRLLRRPPHLLGSSTDHKNIVPRHDSRRPQPRHRSTKRKIPFWTLKTLASEDFDISRLTERQQVAYFAAQSVAAKDNNVLKASPFRIDRILATVGAQSAIPKGIPKKSRKITRISKDLLTSDLISITDSHDTELAKFPTSMHFDEDHQVEEGDGLCSISCTRTDDNPFILDPCSEIPDDAMRSEPHFTSHSYLTRELADYYCKLKAIHEKKRVVALG